jgi:hypothetical protein
VGYPGKLGTVAPSYVAGGFKLSWGTSLRAVLVTQTRCRPSNLLLAAVTGELRSLLVPRNELIGNIVEVVADNLRLRSYFQNIVPNTFDQRCLPARGYGAEGVPCVAGDET